MFILINLPFYSASITVGDVLKYLSTPYGYLQDVEVVSATYFRARQSDTAKFYCFVDWYTRTIYFIRKLFVHETL